MNIAFDAGHGRDTYPPSKGVPQMAEYDFNAAVVGYAKELAEKNGFQIVLTQGLDHNDIPLSRRTQRAFSSDCKCVISFHADANPNSSARGHWVFYWHNHGHSRKLAELWDRIAQKELPIPRRGPRPSEPGTWSNFHMTREPARRNIPAILIEHGFMTNSQDLKYLLSDSYRKKCAEVAVRAVCEYFGKEFKEGEDLGKYFKDVPDDAWYAEAINKMYEKGLLAGYDDGTYKPDDNVTRAELAVVMNRILEVE